jgi:two-component system CheB/CheR fusion protein
VSAPEDPVRDGLSAAGSAEAPGPGPVNGVSPALPSPHGDTLSPFFGFVVAIGASAGGLDALERLFETLPADTGAAYVVIQHLSPDHKSMMDSLLSRHTEMPVRVAEHGMPLAPDCVFLIPPGKYMTLMGDRLQLAPKPDHGLSLPIDMFFHSLADQYHDNAIGVVLSGTGSDGARGLATLNANGGIVLVQDPTSAKFDGMPRSAIATGLVDVVAHVETLAEQLQAHIRAPRSGAQRLLSSDVAGMLALPLDGILQRLAASSGIDFREYKPATVMRRIERRMQVLHCGSLTDYLEQLTRSNEEAALLRRELLIPVTRFFRDPEVWDALVSDVIAELVERRQGPEPIRVWVACCATGEEAYTVAMLFAEAFERLGRDQVLKIFATDAEQQYIDHAAAGLYPGTIAAEVSAQRLARFFVKKDDFYAVRPEIRQSVIFARHNLIADPPFTRMDLVSCRNALIYFQPVAQERGLRRLQYALKPGRFLLLGPSESLGALHRDFSTLNSKLKLYQLVHKERHSAGLDAAVPRLRPAPRASRRLLAASGTMLSRDLEKPVESGLKQLLDQYLPPTLLVGENRELLHVFGDTTGVLQFNPGDVTLDVLKLLPRELSWAAGVLLKNLRANGEPQHSSEIRLPPSDSGAVALPARRVRMVARALPPAVPTASDIGPREPDPLHALLSFEVALADDGSETNDAQMAANIEQREHIDALERELQASHLSLQATIEELETTNAELQATNEELMASNEELQSTNEELQSVNEELYTVNSEYQEKVDILNAVNADLENVSKAAAIPTVFVDEELRLTRFTAQATQLFKLREGDVGRSIEDFAHRLDYNDLFADVRRALKAGVSTECEVRSLDGNWWIASIHPYSDRSRAAPRAVMTFFDITSIKDSQRMQAVIDSLPEHLAVIDPHGTIVYTNEAWQLFASRTCGEGQATPSSGPGTNYLKVCAEAASVDADAQRAYLGLKAVLAGTLPVFTLRYPCHTPTEEQWFLMHAAPIRHGTGGAVVSHINVSGWMREMACPDPSSAEAPAL